MDKDEFIDLLKKLNIPLNEGESSFSNSSKYPRIVFWDYVWEDKLASNENYVTVETYQISFLSSQSRDPKLLELRDLLRDHDLHPTMYHELVDEKGKDRKYYHSYFSVELLVD